MGEAIISVKFLSNKGYWGEEGGELDSRSNIISVSTNRI